MEKPEIKGNEAGTSSLTNNNATLDRDHPSSIEKANESAKLAIMRLMAATAKNPNVEQLDANSSAIDAATIVKFKKGKFYGSQKSRCSNEPEHKYNTRHNCRNLDLHKGINDTASKAIINEKCASRKCLLASLKEVKVKKEIILEESRSKHKNDLLVNKSNENSLSCLLYTSPSPRDRTRSRMPSSA